MGKHMPRADDACGCSRLARAIVAAMGMALLAGALALPATAAQKTDSHSDVAGAASQSGSAKAAQGGRPGADKAAAPVLDEADVACLACHKGEAAALDDPESLMTTHVEAGAVCATCHSDERTLSLVHKKTDGKKAPTSLKRTKVADEACLACHDDAKKLAKATVSKQVEDEKGAKVNPHELPSNDSHDDVRCANCHKLHETKPDASKEALSTCLSCHHAGVFECGTCH